MGELHGELLRRVEVVSRRSATALQAGNDSGSEVTVGGSASVSLLSDLSGLNKIAGKNIYSFTPQVPYHVFRLTSFLQRCL